MLSTTFSCRRYFVIDDCFDTQRTDKYVVLSMRKTYRSLNLTDAFSNLKSENDPLIFVVDNSFITTSHQQL